MFTEYAARSAVGKIRKENQDNLFMNGVIMPCNEKEFACFSSSRDPMQVFALFDGMGGEECGHVASHIAAAAMQEFARDGLPFDYEKYIASANDQVCAYAGKRRIRMGTTLALLSAENEKVSAVNIGDSRIYHISGGKIEQVSKDHTEYQMLLDAGICTEKDTGISDTRNRLTQHIGIPEETMTLSPSVSVFPEVKNGECFLICSDGLSGVLNQDEILREIEVQCDLQEKCDNLVRHAIDSGSRDNVTAMIIKIVSSHANGE